MSDKTPTVWITTHMEKWVNGVHLETLDWGCVPGNFLRSDAWGYSVVRLDDHKEEIAKLEREARRYRALRAMGFSFSYDRGTGKGGFGVCSTKWGDWPESDFEKDVMIDAVIADYEAKLDEKT